MPVSLEPQALDLIRRPYYATVSTLRADGSILGVVVWADADDDGLLTLNSAVGRAWPTNLRRDPRVTITVSNVENPTEYVSVSGRVVREAVGQEADDHIDALAKKYMGVDSYPNHQPGEQRIKFVVEPERVKHKTT